MTWLNTWWNQVSGTVAHGLQITVVGMSLVFLTLGLIIVSLILLTRLPGLRAEAEQKDKPRTTLSEPSVEAVVSESEVAKSAVAQSVAADLAPADWAATDDELAQVAVIAVALLRSRHKVGARSEAQATKSAWKHYGRAYQIGL